MTETTHTDPDRCFPLCSRCSVSVVSFLKQLIRDIFRRGMFLSGILLRGIFRGSHFGLRPPMTPQDRATGLRGATASVWMGAVCILLASGPVNGADPLPSFSDICFELSNSDAANSIGEPWQEWLQDIPGEEGALQLIPHRSGHGCRVQGLVRLAAPWLDATVLRLELWQPQRLSIHLFHGDGGATLVFDSSQRRWTAYTTIRQAGSRRPKDLTLAATDGERTRRSEFGEPVPVSLHYTSGELVLTRGDIVLLGLPFPGLPQEVYLDGRTDIRSIAMTRCAELPSAAVSLPEVAIAPAALAWRASLPPAARYGATDAVRMALEASQAESAGWLTAPLPGRGPRELVLHVSSAKPGTGIFLAPHAFQNPGPVIHFVRNRNDQRTCVVLSDNADSHERDWSPVPSNLVPYVGDDVWIRLVFGAGFLRWWTSTDGHHWAEAEQPRETLTPRCTQLGLYHARGVAGCRIELDRILIRPLTQLAADVPPEVLDLAYGAVDQLAVDQDMIAWRASVAQQRAEGIAPALWERSCLVASLGVGCAPHLGAELLQNRLADRSLALQSLAQRLQLLSEAALLSDSRFPPDSRVLGPEGYLQLAEQAWRQRGELPFSSIRIPLLTSELEPGYLVEWKMERIIRDELLTLIHEGRWESLRHQCVVLNFFGLHRYDPLVAWGDQLSSRQLGMEPVITGRRVPSFNWHPLLSEEISRDVFNHQVELDWLLESGSWEEAAQLVSQLDTSNARGLAAASDDPSLLVSLPVAVRRALDENPRLVEQLEQDHGDLARLRIEQAQRGRRPREVRQLAERFHGMAASRQALQWLGDQELARGQPEPALSWYRQAAAVRATMVDDGLNARQLLAAALAGRGSDAAIRNSVQLGEVTITADELAGIAAELRARQPGPSAATTGLFAAAGPVTGITTPVRHPLPLVVGKDPDKEVLAGVRDLQIDWTGRQLAAQISQGLLLVNNRFQLMALDEHSGEPRWASQPLHEVMLRSQDWPLVPMVPLVFDGLVMARQLDGDVPRLACWNLASGTLLWVGQMDEHVPVSDPFLLDQQLAVLTLDRQRSVDSMLQLRLFSPRTGQPTRSYPLLRLRDSWWQRLVCQVSVSGDRFFAVLGGVALCGDSEGLVRWIRSWSATPPEADRTWVAQHHQPPLLRDDQLILAQPGVRSVEAIDAATGVRRWQTIMPHIHQMVGTVARSVIVHSGTGISSLDISTGRVNWKHAVTDPILAAAYDANDEIVYTRARQVQDNDVRLQVEFVWLDPATGNVVKSLMVENLAGTRPNLGPLVTGQDRTWLFFSDGVSSGQRELVQLQAIEAQPDRP